MSNRTAVISGGATGIGAATALLLAEEGYAVCVIDFDYPDGTRESFNTSGVQTKDGDVRVENDVRSWIDDFHAEHGRLDVLVNCAGVNCIGQIPDLDEEQWDRCIDTNLKGAFLCSKHAVPRMAAGGGGAVVNLASNAGIMPRSHDPVYGVSKAALIMLTRSMALSHARDRIRVNAVCPGPVEGTRLIENEISLAEDEVVKRQQLVEASPLAKAYGRMATTREIAQAVLYLASDDAVMVTGTVLAIDGGKSIGVPR